MRRREDNNQTKEVGVSHRLTGPNVRLIGKPGGLRELTTSALVLDLEAFEENIRAYQHQINLHGTAGTSSRQKPQMCRDCAEADSRRAVGICTASLHETEALVAQGIKNILIKSPVIGAGKLDRLWTAAAEDDCRQESNR